MEFEEFLKDWEQNELKFADFEQKKIYADFKKDLGEWAWEQWRNSCDNDEMLHMERIFYACLGKSEIEKRLEVLK